MAAISHDTAALVAAQLTAAYAARLSAKPPTASVKDEMANVYGDMLTAVYAKHGMPR